MKRLALLVVRLALLVVVLAGTAWAIDSTVAPCGNALCVGPLTPQQATNLGGSVRASAGSYADGGLAVLEPITPGAVVALRGTQFDPYDGGVNTLPDTVIGGRNKRKASEAIASFQTGGTEVARVGPNSTFLLWLDGGAQTKTVPASSVCICQDTTDNSKIPKMPVSGTTGTITGTTGDVLGCHCF